MAEMKTVVVGDILVQDNQERKFGADPQYAVLWATIGKDTIPLIFTEEELRYGINRGLVNPEDIPELGTQISINEWDAE